MKQKYMYRKQMYSHDITYTLLELYSAHKRKLKNTYTGYSDYLSYLKVTKSKMREH